MIRSPKHEKLILSLLLVGATLSACQNGAGVNSSPVALDANYWRVAGGQRPSDLKRLANRLNGQRPFDPTLLRADTAPVWRLNMTHAITSTLAVLAFGANSNASDRLILEGAGDGSVGDPLHYIGVVSNFTTLSPSIMKSPALDSGLEGGAILLNVDGTIAYAVSSAGTVYALSTSNASILWTATLPGGHAWATSWLDFPTNVLYVPDLSGSVTALDATTGTQLWQANAIAGPGVAIHSAPLVYSNVLWVGADNGSLYRLDADTGAPVGSPINLCLNPMSCTTADQIWSGPTIDTNQNQLILGVNKRLIRVDMNLTTFVATTLDTTSYVSTAARFYTSLYIDNPSGGYAYFGYNNRLWRAPYNGSFSTLEIAQTADFAGLLRGVNVDEGYPRGIPIVFNGQIFLGDGGGYMHRFDVSTFSETAVKSFINPGATQNGPAPAIDSTALVDFIGGNCYFAVANPNSPEGAQVALDLNFTSDNSQNGATTHFAVTASVASTTPGSPFHITVTALDSNNNVTTTYSGTVHFTSSDMQAVLPSDYTFTPAVNGSVTFYNATSLSTPGSQTISATDTVNATIIGTTSVTVTAASNTTHFQVTPSTSSPTVGVPFSLTVTALDSFNNVVPGYTGTAHFTSTDGTATLPGDYTFVAGDNGVHTFTNATTLNTAGSQTITSTDTVTASITGSANVAVSAGGAHHFTITPSTSTPAQGEAFHLFVSVRDAQDNPVSGYTGTIHFTSSDPQAILPADYTFSGAYSTVSLFYSTSLHTIGSQTITATDTMNGGISGTSGTIVVGGGATVRLNVVPQTSSASANTPFNVTVTAVDSYGNPTPSYAGTVHFTATDSAMGTSLPADYTFVPGDNGTHVFSVTLVTSGAQTVTATDTVTGTITGSAQVTVSGAVASYDLTASVMTVPQGTVFHLFIRALDGNGGSAGNYSGTAHFTTTDPAGVVPGDHTFTPGYPATSLYNSTRLETPGLQTITATDTVNGSIIGTINIMVTSTT